MRFVRPPRLPVILPVFFNTEETAKIQELLDREPNEDELEIRDCFFNNIDYISPSSFPGKKAGSVSLVCYGGDASTVNIPYKELLKFLDIE